MTDLNALEEIRAKIAAVIERHGFAVQAVLPEDDGGAPSFAYTIGLGDKAGCELLMIGFHPELMVQLLNIAGDLAKKGAQIEDWATSDKVVQDYEVIFRLVPPEVAKEFARGASERHRAAGKEWRLLQMFLPDAEGRYPWQTSCDPAYARLQGHLLDAMPDTRS